MLYRKIENKIIDWLDGNTKALLIDGARQVGKTTIIRHALRNNNFVEFNFLENDDFKDIFEDIEKADTQEIVARISVFSDKKLSPHETIIFIDEVQECKELVTKVKFLVQKTPFRFIFSGSLLGVELNNLRSVPIGYMDAIKMYPLDLEEFLINTGVDDSVFDILRKSYDKLLPVNNAIHSQILKKFNQYLVVGGMPQAVQNFVDNNDYNQVYRIHQNIIEAYKGDFTKYEHQSKKLHLQESFMNIPAELNSQNKRYIIKNLDSVNRYKLIEESFEWLNAAGVSLPVYNCTEPVGPLRLNKKANLFKLFLNDVGLLTTMYGKSIVLAILNFKSTVNYGAIYENFVAQELAAHGYDSYYYSSKKYGELDFVIQTDSVLPIEVKSGKDFTRHNALNNVMSNKAYNIEKAFVFSNENLSVCNVSTINFDKDFQVKDEYRVVYLPIYMTIFIDEDKIDLNSTL